MKIHSKNLLHRILVPVGLLISSIAFLFAQGSFVWWKQPRVPRHLRKM